MLSIGMDTMIFFSIILTAYLTLFIFTLLLWGLSLFKKNSFFMDIAWPLSILITALIYMLSPPATTPETYTLALLAVWALRLTIHLLATKLLPTPTKLTYLKFDALIQNNNAFVLLLKYQLQALCAFIIATPFLFIGNLYQMQAIHYIALTLVTMGLILGTKADLDLFHVKNNNYHHVCKTGLWRFSRHPNYFCEWCIWIGFSLMACNTTIGLIALISPLLLLVILLKITIPFTEKQALEYSGEAYQAYQKTTPRFFPW